MDDFKIDKILPEFLTELRTLRPELTPLLDAEYATLDSEKELAFASEVYRPLAMELVKKDESLFTVPRMFLRGVDFSLFWNDLNGRKKESIWSYLRTALVASYIGDDWVKSLKELWSKYTGKDSSEIDGILGDDKTTADIQELIEFCKETRICKLGMEMVETLKLEQFGVEELDMSDPAGILHMLKDPNHPFMKKAIGVVGSFVETKIRNGSLRKEDLTRELEMIREKFTSSLGKIFKDTMFGAAPNREQQSAQTLLSNSPEARRARMMARLRRKVQERK